MSSYYSDDEDLNIHVSRRRASPPYNYVEPPRHRPVSYFPTEQRPQSYLVPERTVIRTRSRSRERFRRPSPPNSPPAPAPAPAPVIINNRIYNEHSDSEDDRRGLQVMPARHRDHSRSRSRSGSGYMTREEFEMEQTRRELEEMRLHQARDKEERRAQKEFREEAELQRAKRELDTIRAREQQAKEEARIKKEFELQRLREEEREAEEKEKLEKQAKEAVAKYKQKELERIAQEQKEKDAREKEYKRRLQEDLINSGVDEKHIAAILKKEKVPEKVKAPAALPQVPFVPVGNAVARPTYTRMARRHLSIETLRTYRIEYEVDQDPDYVLIRRWVPEWEQDTLWKHTRDVREKRSGRLLLDVGDGDKRRDRDDPKFEWVRKKGGDRKRSKSPALLMYLAGARPA
ncbi:hypothetical protein D7B24_006361 [Verticillium nonalfalfae]|uniref:DUF8035 domain-containing protein n=1 Tax=Verticillium nonalfalfae TaxID=1051616 RepID=A0A3M9Y9K3_9PEZI|nr:uncharacterized protein D7B24_006361 [Verticillium nonalfalfae]RNJ57203.1 hypothetical protein D7B24_006361 [Verticillium nonalfalfae]